MSWTSQLAEVPNALAIFLFVVGGVITWWYFYVQRKIGARAEAVLPIGIDPTKSPFIIRVTNTNTRTFKINSIGFEVAGQYTNRRKGCSFELTTSAGLLKTDKLLITEGDSTDIRFDAYELADSLAGHVRTANIRLTSPDVKIWLYLTHGSKVQVEPQTDLSHKIIGRINEAQPRTN